MLKQRSREEVSSPKTSDVGPHGWYNRGDFKNLTILGVCKKKMSGKLIKMHVFLCFEPFLTSNSDAERRVVVPIPQM